MGRDATGLERRPSLDAGCRVGVSGGGGGFGGSAGGEAAGGQGPLGRSDVVEARAAALAGRILRDIERY